MSRIKQALKAGFQHLIFEDNYDTGTGDHYSLRQICDQSYIKGGFCKVHTFRYKSLVLFPFSHMIRLFFSLQEEVTAVSKTVMKPGSDQTERSSGRKQLIQRNSVDQVKHGGEFVTGLK